VACYGDRMIRLTSLILFLIAAPAYAEDWQGKVVHIDDGDTITVLHDREQVKIGLYGIDAPEGAQPLGNRANQMTGDLAAGKIVTVKPKDNDRYGRTVAGIILPDGRSLTQELARAGLAWHYVRYVPRDKELARLEAEAREAKRGLWADKEPMAPWDWRGRSKAKSNSR